MRRLVVLAAVALLVGTGGAYAQDKTKADKPAKAAAKTMSAVGTLKSVTADSVVVTDAKGKDWTFSVDAKTVVTAKGAGTKAAAARSAGKAGPTVTEVLKAGDKVTVKYHDMGGTMHAESVRVM